MPGDQVSLRVTLVQTASTLDPAQNRARLDEAGELAPASDLVVLPEAFARDFGKAGTDLREYAEPLDGPFVTRLREVSSQSGVAVLAGMFETRGRDLPPWNTLVLADGDQLTTYRKIHLYDSFGYRESDVLAAGDTGPVVVDVRGFPLGLMTCYDLRFPELGRALVERGAEALVVPAAWVAGNRKVAHWTTLLRARAIEDVCYVVGVGQPGPRYTGFSTVVGPEGDVLAQAGAEEAVVGVVLERAAVAAAREANPSLDNRRAGLGVPG
ncbi:carbon-nitrogen hydrolase family protein [Nocardioides mangrovicus]|uniref:Carbon-nitrogen hydrolase family protein n=1 Tax=Nocardioides mangrovicus TaxID=2478913 RepID=A0A3L8P0P0_9ACTN|nr:carbon-nitrogen hydrolase family protein [Nocardioides mangrovicus]RLV48159.1 carbon-nitrogen hydrolase family protein [Nocardioides mangrovicus]